VVEESQVGSCDICHMVKRAEGRLANLQLQSGRLIRSPDHR
jgi:hypothetical protein